MRLMKKLWDMQKIIFLKIYMKILIILEKQKKRKRVIFRIFLIQKNLRKKNIDLLKNLKKDSQRKSFLKKKIIKINMKNLIFLNT